MLLQSINVRSTVRNTAVFLEYLKRKFDEKICVVRQMFIIVKGQVKNIENETISDVCIFDAFSRATNKNHQYVY